MPQAPEHGQDAEPEPDTTLREGPEHVDVLIVGAGLSGIGAACHLRRSAPGKSFAVLEGREAIGGTWDLFRYPGVRSDSDMHTLGYAFRPWTEERAIVDGASIRAYIQETARTYGVDRAIRFGHRVSRAEWSSAEGRWTVTVQRAGAPGETHPEGTHHSETHPGEKDLGEKDLGEKRLTCTFLFVCAGYYRYDEGYTPDFPGIAEFGGQVVHPQHWPADLDHAGKRIVVIGSGATAVTLVPALAETAAHVTMVQRSPSHVLALPSKDLFARPLNRILPRRTAGSALRWKNALLALANFQLSRRAPRFVAGALRRAARRRLPSGYDVDTHFRPSYGPWDQRLCIAPDGDLFTAIRRRRASVATDTVAGFTPTGVRLGSGEELAADVVVTATGLNLLAIGGIGLTVDGKEIDVADTVAYKGMMLSGVPNFALTIGYTNASWTLKADLVATYVCRLLAHMDEHGYDVCTPQLPDDGGALRPLIDLDSGYVRRSLDALPKQGATAPWRLNQNYPRDVRTLRHGPVQDRGVRFERTARTRP
ncbi:flavin-containing monooxygenase [Streptomyces cavernicola]|uniref:NAD(P)/FAD-dependent oxidoreductase n=1 Tax=Streptomyces cavernicola TaxID=3043613 RepID=A0ABT6S3J4_9ACTN|nr:NAD(P)/FAD-dependent oxidoreductase [Streptomyces sp. B-S-A6]MDI3402637.1 NAD(P)/FAD-dependent oxidoreductase [Streptomyces sp. B-S-A6]